uniref:Protein m42 n=1 Tax=Mastomys natalensis cytomegalovirus 2 TaxID=2973540 RepID=A0A9Y1N871_9BETA|nr:protein m42 [Mastomys natalensis cytomegalovirus 2]WEG69185.1 protein m42 [Mastomys natalensis cytomegalovirus 2]WEG69324.1 protein m42 [Mastomys natalensis cytomegalovirus 2]WEG69462.1 protein m42 [Mastomys natalensis cytomegalovirus 2]WEG69600.1 protein m42 [Mastomys natalensis cytomegalovirus 2]
MNTNISIPDPPPVSSDRYPDGPLPTYQEAVGLSGERVELDLSSLPTYDALFSGTQCESPRGGSGDREDPNDEPPSGDNGTRDMLATLDREFKWTALSVGLLVAVLVVLVLIIIIVAFPRERL